MAFPIRELYETDKERRDAAFEAELGDIGLECPTEHDEVPIEVQRYHSACLGGRWGGPYNSPYDQKRAERDAEMHISYALGDLLRWQKATGTTDAQVAEWRKVLSRDPRW